MPVRLLFMLFLCFQTGIHTANADAPLKMQAQGHKPHRPEEKISPIEAAPSRALLEFLAEFSEADGQWLDPDALETIELPESEKQDER